MVKLQPAKEATFRSPVVLVLPSLPPPRYSFALVPGIKSWYQRVSWIRTDSGGIKLPAMIHSTVTQVAQGGRGGKRKDRLKYSNCWLGQTKVIAPGHHTHLFKAKRKLRLSNNSNTSTVVGVGEVLHCTSIGIYYRQ